jgi:putative transposase
MPRAVPIPSGGMVTTLFALVSLSFRFRSRASLELELVALRHQVIVLRRHRPTDFGSFPPTGSCGCGFPECGRRSSKPWHSSNRRLWSSGIAEAFGFTGDGDHAPGRPKTSDEVRDLIRQMGLDNPLWGAPRVHGELLKLGIEVSQATVGRYLPRRPKAPSPTWRSFLRNHMTVIVAIHTFLVATAMFRMLYAVIVLDHHRRRVVHFGVTRNPTQVWLAWQITEAFPWDTAPRYLLRDRDTSYGLCFQNRVRAMGIEEVLTASVPHGKVHTSKELLAQSVARSSMRHTYVASCLVIIATITRAERICR